MIGLKSVVAILGLLVLVVVGSVSLFIVEDSTEDPWLYGEYRDIEGAVSASGSLELVDGRVHAVSVGRGDVLLSDGSRTTVTVERAPLDVFLMTGQSNSTYRYQTADHATASPVPPPGAAYMWATPDGNWTAWQDSSDLAFLPMTSGGGESLTGGLAPAFAATYYENSGRFSYWICGGWGGMEIAEFDPENGKVWDAMENTVQEAVKAIDRELFEPRYMSYMWIQGESDWDTPIPTYKSAFMLMHDAILNGKLGVPFDMCLISLPRTSDAVNAVEAQIQLARENSDTIRIVTDIADTFTVENGLMASDDLHYTQEGCNMLGSVLGKACADLTPHVYPKPLLSVIPIVLTISIGVMAIGLALRAIMGRE